MENVQCSLTAKQRKTPTHTSYAHSLHISLQIILQASVKKSIILAGLLPFCCLPALHKGTSDMLFHFGWQPSSLPLACICCKPFTVGHALSCSCLWGGGGGGGGGERFPSIHHNKLCHKVCYGEWREISPSPPPSDLSDATMLQIEFFSLHAYRSAIWFPFVIS